MVHVFVSLLLFSAGGGGAWRLIFQFSALRMSNINMLNLCISILALIKIESLVLQRGLAVSLQFLDIQIVYL